MYRTASKLAPIAVLAGAVALGGCATKSYVREQIAPVSQRVDSLETRLQATDATAKSALAEAQAAEVVRAAAARTTPASRCVRVGNPFG